MPIHDWSRVPAGLFHHFHQDWTVEIARDLNRGRLPKGLSALVEQRAARMEPDVLAIESHSGLLPGSDRPGGTLALERPVTRIIRESTSQLYALRANRVVVRHHLGQIIAVIEIVSPGNKHSRAALRDFVDQAIGFLREGVHLLIVDLFPPTARDPYGIHKAIWDEIEEEPFVFPEGKDRILAAYSTGTVKTAFVEPVALGERLPDMPLFLTEEQHLAAPLEATYQAAWDASPEELRTAVETSVTPLND